MNVLATRYCFFLSTCRVNTLVCAILRWSNKCPSPQCFFYTGSGWLKFAYVANAVPPETRHVTYKTALPTTLVLPFFYTSGTLHARHIRAIFELLGRPFRLYVAMKGIQFPQLRCHISFLLFTRLTTCFFLSSRGRLLNSHKRRLLRKLSFINIHTIVRGNDWTKMWLKTFNWL